MQLSNKVALLRRIYERFNARDMDAVLAALDQNVLWANGMEGDHVHGGNAVAKQFGLVFALPPDLRELYASFGVDLARFNGDNSWTLPMPARFVIDRAGIIRKVDTDPDYTVRPDPSETVQALNNLRPVPS